MPAKTAPHVPKRSVEPEHDLRSVADAWRARASSTGKDVDRGIATVLDALASLSADPHPETALQELQKTADAYLRGSQGPTFRKKREAAETLARKLKSRVSPTLTSEEVERLALFACALLERDGLATEQSLSAVASAIKSVNKQIEKLSKPPLPHAHAERWVTAIFTKLGVPGAKEILSGLRKRGDEEPRELTEPGNEHNLKQLLADPEQAKIRAEHRAELQAQFPRHKR